MAESLLIAGARLLDPESKLEEELIVRPPGLPVIKTGSPSFRTIVGVIDDNGRFPGAIALASPWISPNMFLAPTIAVKSSISLFSRIPVPDTVTPFP